MSGNGGGRGVGTGLVVSPSSSSHASSPTTSLSPSSSSSTPYLSSSSPLSLSSFTSPSSSSSLSFDESSSENVTHTFNVHSLSPEEVVYIDEQLQNNYVGTFIEGRLFFTHISGLDNTKGISSSVASPNPMRFGKSHSSSTSPSIPPPFSLGGNDSTSSKEHMARFAKRLVIFEDVVGRRLFVRIGPSYVYRRFFADFGPFDLSTTVRFCRRFEALLHSSFASGKKVYFASSVEEHERANCSVLIGAYAVFCLLRSADEAHKPLLR